MQALYLRPDEGLLRLAVDELLFAEGTRHRLSVHGQLGIAGKPGTLDIVLLVHRDHLLVVEEIVHHEEVQGRTIDAQLICAKDLSIYMTSE